MNSAIRNWLCFVTLALMLAALFMIFDYVPTEVDEGIVQRIFYFHVPCAWVAFAAFGLVGVAGVLYLWLGGQIWDDLGYAASETGMVFCTRMLVTGSPLPRPVSAACSHWDSRRTPALFC